MIYRKEVSLKKSKGSWKPRQASKGKEAFDIAWQYLEQKLYKSGKATSSFVAISKQGIGKQARDNMPLDLNALRLKTQYSKILSTLADQLFEDLRIG